MGFRFWRRVKIAPGVTLNLSKSGGSLSIGPRGAKITVGPRGRRATVGIPGTGLFYTTKLDKGRGRRPSGGAPPQTAADGHLDLGFFQRLVIPPDERELVEALRALVAGDEAAVQAHLQHAVHLADGAYLAGFLALKQGKLREAGLHLAAAAEKDNELGTYFSKYGISATMNLAIADLSGCGHAQAGEISAAVGPDLRGVLLALVEINQRLKRWQDALACLERLVRLEPDDVVVKLSLAELLLEIHPGDPAVCKRVVELAAHIENESAFHAALLLYKARALRGLGLADAARETLTTALRRKKGRSGELLRALRYERALVYEDLGQRARAKAELEKLYAEDPDYEDVAARLGLGAITPKDDATT